MPRALVVDDDDAIRELLQLHLGREGFEVVAAADGVEARERLEERPFDVVVTDLTMPRCDGVELIAGIRERSDLDGVPVLLFTASAPGDARLGEAARFPNVTIHGKGGNFRAIAPLLRALIERLRSGEADEQAAEISGVAQELVDPERRLPGEPDRARSVAEAEAWAARYERLLASKRGMLAVLERARTGIGDGAEGQELDLDERTMTAEADRMRRRLAFWSEERRRTAGS